MHVTPVKSGFIPNGPDLQLNYLEWGQPDGLPVVLIIGLRGFAYTWRTTAEALGTKYRVIALNLRGHGDSGPSPDREFSFDTWDDDTHALVTTLGLDRPVIIGHSLGGRVAFVYGARHPENTRGAVVVDVGPGFPEDAAWRVKRGMESDRTEFDSWQEAVDYLIARKRPNVPESRIEERAPYALRQLPSGKVIFKYDPLLREEWLGDAPPPRAQLPAWLWPDWDANHCPTLLLKGENTDFLTPALCDEMVSRAPGNARWAEIPGTTHFIMDDNLEGFLKEVEPFITECFNG